MQKTERIKEFPFIVLTGFIVLGIINAILRTALSFQNIAVFTVVIIFIVTVYKTKWKAAEKIGEIKPIYIYGFFSVLAMLTLIIFPTNLWDDPLQYHEQILKDIEEGTIKINNPYSIRGLFFLYPIYKIFGANIMIVQIINLLFYVFTGVLFKKLLEQIFNNDKGIVNTGTILIYSIPFLILGIKIPHWDTVSFLYQILAMYLLNSLFKELKNGKITINYKIILLSMLLGISYTFLFYTRGLKTAIIITIILFGVFLLFSKNYEGKYKIKIAIYSMILPLIIYYTTDTILKSSSFADKTDYGRSQAQMVFSYNDTRFDGTGGHKDKKWVYFPEIPSELKTEYAIRKLNSEIYYNWPWYLFRLNTKSTMLYTIQGFNEWIVKNSQYEKIISTIINYWELILQYIILILCIPGFYYYYYNFNTWKDNTFLLFTTAFIFVCTLFSLFSEVNTRYSLVFVYGLIVFSLIGIKGIAAGKNTNFINAKRLSFKYGTVLIFFILVFFMYRITVAKYYKFEQLNEHTYNKEIGKVNLTAFQKQIDKNDRTIVLETPDNSKQINFFLRTSIKNTEKQFSFETDDGTKFNVNVEKDKFKKLKTDSTVVITFVQLDITKKTNKQLKLEFPENMTEDMLIVEYASFN